MLLATLFPAYNALEFDIEIATESPIRLVKTVEEAMEWAEAEIREGRDPDLEVVLEENAGGFVSWIIPRNEDGSVEEWLLHVREIGEVK